MTEEQFFQAISEQSEELHDFCKKNFYSIPSLIEEGGDDFFPHYTYIQYSAYPNLEAMNAVAVVYLSESSFRGGFTVDFVNCSMEQILDVVRMMVKKANIAIDIVYMATLEEAEMIRACDLYYHSN